MAALNKIATPLFQEAYEVKEGERAPALEAPQDPNVKIAHLRSSILHPLTNNLNDLIDVHFVFEVELGLTAITAETVERYYHGKRNLNQLTFEDNSFNPNPTYAVRMGIFYQNFTHSFPNFNTTIPCLAHFFISMGVKTIVDFGGGEGLYARSLADNEDIKNHGIKVISIDLKEPKFRFYDVRVENSPEESFETLKKLSGPECGLVLCWPPQHHYKEGPSMATTALEIFEAKGGKCFCYIGEDAIVADEAFHRKRSAECPLVQHPKRASTLRLHPVFDTLNLHLTRHSDVEDVQRIKTYLEQATPVEAQESRPLVFETTPLLIEFLSYRNKTPQKNIPYTFLLSKLLLSQEDAVLKDNVSWIVETFSSHFPPFGKDESLASYSSPFFDYETIPKLMKHLEHDLSVYKEFLNLLEEKGIWNRLNLRTQLNWRLNPIDSQWVTELFPIYQKAEKLDAYFKIVNDSPHKNHFYEFLAKDYGVKVASHQSQGHLNSSQIKCVMHRFCE